MGKRRLLGVRFFERPKITEDELREGWKRLPGSMGLSTNKHKTTEEDVSHTLRIHPYMSVSAGVRAVSQCVQDYLDKNISPRTLFPDGA